MAAISIPIGESVVIDAAITGPVAGTIFGFEPDPDGGDFSCAFHVTGTVTTCSADLQMSLDGGATFFAISVALITAAAPAKTFTPIIAGALYRFNYTAASGSIVMRVASN
jgi:hypothetical protein